MSIRQPWPTRPSLSLIHGIKPQETALRGIETALKQAEIGLIDEYQFRALVRRWVREGLR